MHILCDIGGTKMRVAGTRDLQSFDKPLIVKTPGDFNEGMEVLKKTIGKIRGGDPVESICLGIPGEIDPQSRILSASPNMPGWVGHSIEDSLRKIFGCQVTVHNDAALVGLGEAVYGSGKGYGIVAYVTVSTGVGGARIVEGKIDEASIGFEPGQQIIDIDSTACPECGKPGTLEHLVSGTALKNRFGVEPYEVRDPKVWEELSRFLAYGLYNSVLHWSPDIVVLGGSMITGDPAIPVDRVRTHLESLVSIFPKAPEIKEASLKDIGGIYGALAFLRTNSKDRGH